MNTDTLRTRYSLIHFAALGCEPDLTKTLDWDLDRLNREVQKMKWVAQATIEQMDQEYWDMYKDTHGYRPRGISREGWTKFDYVNEFDSLARTMHRQEDAAKKAAEDAITAGLSSGAKTREQAIQWLHDAHETQGDPDMLCYEFEVPYGYFGVKEIA